MLQEEIKKIIEKDLPNTVGQILQKQLKLGEENANTVIELLKRNKDLTKDLKDYTEDIKYLNQQLAEHKKIDIKLKELEEKERNLKLILLEDQLKSEKDKVQFSKDVALGLVRNTQYKSTIFDQHCKMVPMLDGSGYLNVQNVTHTKTNTETKQAE